MSIYKITLESGETVIIRALNPKAAWNDKTLKSAPIFIKCLRSI